MAFINRTIAGGGLKLNGIESAGTPYPGEQISKGDFVYRTSSSMLSRAQALSSLPTGTKFGIMRISNTKYLLLSHHESLNFTLYYSLVEWDGAAWVKGTSKSITLPGLPSRSYNTQIHYVAPFENNQVLIWFQKTNSSSSATYYTYLYQGVYDEEAGTLTLTAIAENLSSATLYGYYQTNGLYKFWLIQSNKIIFTGVINENGADILGATSANTSYIYKTFANATFCIKTSSSSTITGWLYLSDNNQLVSITGPYVGSSYAAIYGYGTNKDLYRISNSASITTAVSTLEEIVTTHKFDKASLSIVENVETYPCAYKNNSNTYEFQEGSVVGHSWIADLGSLFPGDHTTTATTFIYEVFDKTQEPKFYATNDVRSIAEKSIRNASYIVFLNYASSALKIAVGDGKTAIDSTALLQKATGYKSGSKLYTAINTSHGFLMTDSGFNAQTATVVAPYKL